MAKMNKKIFRLGIASLGLFGSLALVISTTSAETGEVSLTINTGTSACIYGTSIDLGSQQVALDFGALVFTGDFLTNDTTNTWSCTDYDGTPGGWDLTLQSSQLASPAGNTIAANLITISHDAPAMTVGNCTAGGDVASGVSIDTTNSIVAKAASTPNRTVCTVVTSGVTLQVNVPANQAPGSYTGTLTITLPTFN